MCIRDRGIAVDVGVFPLDIVICRRLKGQILVNAHQFGIHVAHAGAFRTVEDEFLGGTGTVSYTHLVSVRFFSPGPAGDQIYAGGIFYHSGSGLDQILGIGRLCSLFDGVANGMGEFV